ncbi:HD domain-containing phosphohydrolase [Aminipila terrae]|uniref:Stage 0 sporulation protein A homolog n=1 Tax=Aminipila terrae TaxID=2697030 RepID=A0A6P1MH63_9FIRM|nr:HD domain-containing phosphohydrolase [Aminipila terrae]QHI71924.1 response regulator [Aminipila terrae]
MDNSKKILIADASQFDRSVMDDALKNTYTILETQTGLKALELFIEEVDNIKLAIIDIAIPLMDGFDVLQHIKRLDKAKSIPVILTSKDAVKEDILKAFQYGAADFMTKPFEADFLRQRVLALLSNSSKIPGTALTNLVTSSEADIDEIKEYDKSLNKTLRNLFSYRQIETPYHLKRVSLFTGTLLKILAKNSSSGVNLSESQIELIIRASIYHDIGKIAIPDDILRRKSNLTDKQRLIYQTHTAKGAEVLEINTNPSLHSFIQLAVNIAQNHHENWDGSGYPNKLKGNEIPLSAQVVRLATDFDKFSRDIYGITDTVFEVAMEKVLELQQMYNPMLIRALAHSEFVMNKIMDKYSDSSKKTK